jgi:hypothetical protein
LATAVMASREDKSDEDDDGPKRPGLVARLSKKNDSKAKAAALGSQLRAELDEMLRAEKDRKAALEGKAVEPPKFKLYQTLYEFKSEDPDDLNFEAGEILRFAHFWTCFPLDFFP